MTISFLLLVNILPLSESLSIPGTLALRTAWFELIIELYAKLAKLVIGRFKVMFRVGSKNCLGVMLLRADTLASPSVKFLTSFASAFLLLVRCDYCDNSSIWPADLQEYTLLCSLSSPNSEHKWAQADRWRSFGLTWTKKFAFSVFWPMTDMLTSKSPPRPLQIFLLMW